LRKQKTLKNLHFRRDQLIQYACSGSETITASAATGGSFNSEDPGNATAVIWSNHSMGRHIPLMLFATP